MMMESTSVYWQPIYNILEGQLEVLLVNAHHMKQAPGRKTDIKDAKWLAQLLQYGLVRRSFIPDRQQRELRDVMRYRQSVVDVRNRVAKRAQKILEDANLKLAAVVSNIQGVSGQEMLRAPVGGEEDPKLLAELARWQSAGHLAAWGGWRLAITRPRASSARQSAEGDTMVRRALIQAAKAAERKKGSYLKALNHRLAARGEPSQQAACHKT